MDSLVIVIIRQTPLIQELFFSSFKADTDKETGNSGEEAQLPAVRQTGLSSITAQIFGTFMSFTPTFHQMGY